MNVKVKSAAGHGECRRKNIRLRDYDYSQNGAYFVTICTQDKRCLFGKIVNGEMVLNKAGLMVKSVWEELPIKYDGFCVDVFQVMPNHFHGIILIVGNSGRTNKFVGAGTGDCPYKTFGNSRYYSSLQNNDDTKIC